jgi:hypothetical protein
VLVRSERRPVGDKSCTGIRTGDHGDDRLLDLISAFRYVAELLM